VTHSPERFTIRIADEGEGFDAANIPDPLAPENLMRTSGRGIFLIRSFMDEFEMRHREPQGTEVTLSNTWCLSKMQFSARRHIQ